MTNLLFGFPGGWELIVILIVLLLFVLPWLFALIDCLKGEFKGNDKLIWILLILLVPFLGMILYFLIGRGQKVTQ